MFDFGCHTALICVLAAISEKPSLTVASVKCQVSEDHLKANASGSVNPDQRLPEPEHGSQNLCQPSVWNSTRKGAAEREDDGFREYPTMTVTHSPSEMSPPASFVHSPVGS